MCQSMPRQVSVSLPARARGDLRMPIVLLPSWVNRSNPKHCRARPKGNRKTSTILSSTRSARAFTFDPRPQPPPQSTMLVITPTPADQRPAPLRTTPGTVPLPPALPPSPSRRAKKREDRTTGAPRTNPTKRSSPAKRPRRG